MNVALCILTLNERPCLEKIFPLIPKPSDNSGYDKIYAIDGGSKDGTVEYLNKHNVTCISQKNKGRGDAMLTAFEKIKSDAYIFFSPDGNENPKDLPKFKRYLSQGNDLVIASRIMKGSHNEEDDNFFKPRKWANIFFNILANLFFKKSGNYIYDTINGYRAITKKATNIMKLDAPDYTIEYQMTIRAFKNSLSIAEFPTYEGKRVAGETGVPSIPTGIRFIKRFLKELIG